MGGRLEGWTVWMRGRTDLIFLGLVRGGHVSQILDHLLGVLCLTSTRFSSTRQREKNAKSKDSEKDVLKLRRETE